MMLDSIHLGDLHWVDEFEWDKIGQETTRSVSGGLLVQAGEKHHGRPITLASDGGEWTPLAVVRSLELLRDTLGRVMQLTLPDGRQFSVIFNRESPPLEAAPLFRQVNPGADHLYEITLRLLTVAPPEPEPEPDPEP
ncbi:MAG: hypothetical protein GX665_12440 [Gammaproteobacteria bacterium]|nr:hypothetical protein [Gammaproteobacteria bacterium]